MQHSIPYIIAGIVGVLLIDSIGSITSRKFNYHYGTLTPLSFALYTMIGYHASGGVDYWSALFSAVLVGIFDATVGWEIAIYLKANFGENKEQAMKLDTVARVVYMMFIGALFGFIGFGIATL